MGRHLREHSADRRRRPRSPFRAVFRAASILGLVLATSLLATSGTVFAQDDEPPVDTSMDDEGRALFEAGLTAYQNARYDSALQYFRQAYEASGRPELLHNIGQAADRARRDAEAIEAFEAFLAAVPDTDRREAIEQRIANLRAHTAAGGTDESALAGSIALFAGGALISAAGVVIFLLGDGMRNDVQNAAPGTPFADVEDAFRTAPDLLLSGQVVGWIGAAVAAGGLTWMIITLTDDGAAGGTQVQAGFGSVELRGRF